MDQDNFYMMLELCEHQSMRELINKQTRLTELEVSYYLSQLVDAVSYIHSKQVIHRDLKIDNLFLDKNLHIKVGDFGLAIHISTLDDTNYKEICGTPNYVAPETLKKHITKNQCFGVDIWSIGVICYTLLIGKPPFAAKSQKTTFQRILLNQYTFPPHIQLSDYAKGIVSMILQTEPIHR
jgi:polo-like kinase 1